LFGPARVRLLRPNWQPKRVRPALSPPRRPSSAACREALDAPATVTVAPVCFPPPCRPSRQLGATRRVPRAAAAPAPARAESRPNDSGSQALRRSARIATTQALLRCVRFAGTRRQLTCCCSSCPFSAWCVVPPAIVATLAAAALLLHCFATLSL
jgi:hypothetical protein